MEFLPEPECHRLLVKLLTMGGTSAQVILPKLNFEGKNFFHLMEAFVRFNGDSPEFVFGCSLAEGGEDSAKLLKATFSSTSCGLGGGSHDNKCRIRIDGLPKIFAFLSSANYLVEDGSVVIIR